MTPQPFPENTARAPLGQLLPNPKARLKDQLISFVTSQDHGELRALERFIGGAQILALQRPATTETRRTGKVKNRANIGNGENREIRQPREKKRFLSRISR